MLKKTTIILGLLSQFVFAQNNIVIYNNDLALISENKTINIQQGNSEINYENVSSQIIKDSVAVKFPSQVSVFEQNYRYNLINFSSILKHTVGKKIKFLVDNKNNKKTTIKTGILLSNNNPILIQEKEVSTGNKGNIFVVEAKNIQFIDLPKNMTSKPSLVWKIKSLKQYLDFPLSMQYLSRGFSWKSNYVFSLEDNRLQLNSWITLNNNSEMKLTDFNLTLLAGEVNQIKPNVYRKDRRNYEMMALSKAQDIEPKALMGFYTYKIPFKVNIEPKSQKQISFLQKEVQSFKFINKFNLNNQKRDFKGRFIKSLKFSNTEKNGVGVPLPGGIARVYKKNNLNENFFIGESTIKNTPITEEVELILGEDFNSSIDAKVVKYTNNKYQAKINYEIIIKNNSKENMIYKILANENVSHYRAFKFSSNCKNECSSIKNSVGNYDLTVMVKKNSEFLLKIEKEYTKQ